MGFGHRFLMDAHSESSVPVGGACALSDRFAVLEGHHRVTQSITASKASSNTIGSTGKYDVQRRDSFGETLRLGPNRPLPDQLRLLDICALDLLRWLQMFRSVHYVLHPLEARGSSPNAHSKKWLLSRTTWPVS